MTGLLLALALATGQPDAPQAHSERPSWCQPGYVCLPTRQAADITIRLADMEAELTAAKAARGRRWDWMAACGPAVSAYVSQNQVNLGGTVSCVVGFGVRLGR